jgi:hypothetical protein
MFASGSSIAHLARGHFAGIAAGIARTEIHSTGETGGQRAEVSGGGHPGSNHYYWRNRYWRNPHADPAD